MSIESTFKNHIDINLNPNRSLQPKISEREHRPVTRHSLKFPSKERYRQDRSKSRNRTLSVTEESTIDKTAELTSVATSSNKHDKRQSEIKSTVEQNDHTPIDRRNSIPQLHLSTLFSNPFRNPKHHHKTNIKDETNATSITLNNNNALVNTSSNHFVDTMTMKADPPFTLKSPTSPTNSSRLVPWNSNERLLSSHNEDSRSSSSFIFEEIASEPRSTEFIITESHTPICVSEIYHDQFFEYFHTNYCGEFDYEGPFIASLRYINLKNTSADICEARVIVRTLYRNCYLSELVDGTNENNVLQMLFSKINLPPIRTYGPIGDPKANEKIYLFDKTNDERYNCKIGVIYQRLHQTNEYDIFSNDYPSDDMWNFLDVLADHVLLKGWQKYRGDLDIKEDLHGDYSYYTVYEDHEIMFNIAPIIPSTKANGQCIERKGLVGNAFVCIVFQEPGAIFSPDFISGRVTQIYITVQPTVYNEQVYYKIGIWRRNDIKSAVNPSGGIYKLDKSFPSFFLTLLLNSVNVAIESPSLRSRVYEQRQRLKCEELRKLSYIFSLGPIPDFNSEIDNIHHQMDMRSGTRSESFTSNATATTSDSASTNPGRTSPASSSKKRGFSRKIFNVFSSRSGSISSPIATPHHVNNDGVPGTPQTPSSADALMSFARTSLSSSKETANRIRSSKSIQAPVLPARASNSQVPQAISIQPPTPFGVSSNPLNTDNSKQNNPLNTAALDITPRNRSNSSPEDTVNTNKSQLPPRSKIVEEDPSTDGSDDEVSEDESSEDDES